MKRSELQQIIREEIKELISEAEFHFTDDNIKDEAKKLENILKPYVKGGILNIKTSSGPPPWIWVEYKNKNVNGTDPGQFRFGVHSANKNELIIFNMLSNGSFKGFKEENIPILSQYSAKPNILFNFIKKYFKDNIEKIQTLG